MCVIGAGIAGLTTAYLLARDGRSVVLIDAGEVGNGQTAVTTAHLSSVIDDGFIEMLRLHGPDGARLAYDSHEKAVDRIATICATSTSTVTSSGWMATSSSERTSPSRSWIEELEAARAAGANVTKLPSAPWTASRAARAFAIPARPSSTRCAISTAWLALVRRGGRFYSGTKAVHAEGGEIAPA